MVKREEVERWLRNANNGVWTRLNAQDLAELCHLWLAVDGAPVVQITECNQVPGARDFDHGDMVNAVQQFGVSQRVKLVLVPEADSGGEG